MAPPDLSELCNEINRLLEVQRAARQVIHLWQQGKVRGLFGYENQADQALLALREKLDR